MWLWIAISSNPNLQQVSAPKQNSFKSSPSRQNQGKPSNRLYPAQDTRTSARREPVQTRHRPASVAPHKIAQHCGPIALMNGCFRPQLHGVPCFRSRFSGQLSVFLKHRSFRFLSPPWTLNNLQPFFGCQQLCRPLFPLCGFNHFANNPTRPSFPLFNLFLECHRLFGG